MAGKVSIGSAWSEAAAFLQRERRVLAPVVLGLILFPAVITTMVQPPAAAGDSPEPGAWMMVAFGMLLVMFVGQMAIVGLIDRPRGSVGEAIARALRRLPTLILAALMVMVPLVVFLSVVLSVLGVTATGDGRIAADSVGTGGALAFLIVPALMLYLGTRLLPLVAVIARGSEGPVAALKRTFRMTGGQFWRLFGFFVLLALAFVVAALAVGAVVGSIVILALERPDPWSVSLLLIALAGGLVQAAWLTVFTAMLARIADQLDGAPGSESTSGT